MLLMKLVKWILHLSSNEEGFPEMGAGYEKQKYSNDCLGKNPIEGEPETAWNEMKDQDGNGGHAWAEDFLSFESLKSHCS